MSHPFDPFGDANTIYPTVQVRPPPPPRRTAVIGGTPSNYTSTLTDYTPTTTTTTEIRTSYTPTSTTETKTTTTRSLYSTLGSNSVPSFHTQHFLPEPLPRSPSSSSLSSSSVTSSHDAIPINSQGQLVEGMMVYPPVSPKIYPSPQQILQQQLELQRIQQQQQNPQLLSQLSQQQQQHIVQQSVPQQVTHQIPPPKQEEAWTVSNPPPTLYTPPLNPEDLQSLLHSLRRPKPSAFQVVRSSQATPLQPTITSPNSVFVYPNSQSTPSVYQQTSISNTSQNTQQAQIPAPTLPANTTYSSFQPSPQELYPTSATTPASGSYSLPQSTQQQQMPRPLPTVPSKAPPQRTISRTLTNSSVIQPTQNISGGTVITPPPSATPKKAPPVAPRTIPRSLPLPQPVASQIRQLRSASMFHQPTTPQPHVTPTSQSAVFTTRGESTLPSPLPAPSTQKSSGHVKQLQQHLQQQLQQHQYHFQPSRQLNQSSPSQQQIPRQPSLPKPDPQPTLARALWDCCADQEGDLEFKAGDLISILNKDPSGWWVGQSGGKTGNFPANYVCDI